MRMKRTLAAALTGALLCGMLALPASAQNATAFNDIRDAETAEAAQILNLLGVVDGTGNGHFEPERKLSRAEFCKMAVELMGNGDKAEAQMNRTIFHDVPSTHWARGYINVATQGATTGTGDKASTTPGIIRGDPSGNFSPDAEITYAAAVTILMRILGYSDSDVGFGGTWYTNYLSKAKAIELTDGLALGPDDSLTRGQAALLMENLLYTEPNGSKDDYLVSKLECKIVDEVLIFDTDATAPDGTTGALKVKDKTYKTDRPPFSEDLVGRRAKLVLDKDDKVLAVQPSTQGTQKVVGILSAAYNSVKVSGGSELKVKPETVVWKDGEEKTFKDVYQNLTSGTQALFQYSAAGELEYIFLRASAKTDDSTRVLKTKPSPSASEPSYLIYKNGVPASVKDLRQYDVTTMDSVNNVMYVSDVRITGIYENVYPNPETPATVRVMGHDFPVLDTAASDLASFKLGSTITLLLSYNGQVAGAVEPSVAKSTTVGTVDSIDADSGRATITTLNLTDPSGSSIKLQGETSYKNNRAEEMQGQLVTVSSSQIGRLSLSRLSGSGTRDDMDVASRKIGDVELAENVRLYDQAYSVIGEVEYGDLTRGVIPAAQIDYIHKDYAGRADIVVFNNATGDMYTYGFFKYTPSTREPYQYIDEDGNEVHDVRVTNARLAIKTALSPDGTDDLICVNNVEVKKDAAGGIVEGSRRRDSSRTLGAFVELKSAYASASAFDLDAMTVETSSAVYPIARNVQCYNAITKTWFTLPASPDDDDYKDALNAARAFSDELTIYFDKAPEDGGKIRLVVVE